MNIVAEGVAVASASDPNLPSACFPNICVLPSGRWMLGYRAARTKGGSDEYAKLTWSDDQGKTWSPPFEPFAPPALNGRIGRLRALAPTPLGGKRVLATVMWVDRTNPDLPLFNEKTQGVLDCRLFVATSEDEGRTWSPMHAVDRTPYESHATPITGPTLLLADGRWACQFELNNQYEDTSPWHHASVLTFSADEGRTWGNAVETARHPEHRVFYWDQRPSVLRDGTLIDFFWTYDNAAAKYVNIHGRSSRDSGRTWSALWDAGIPGQPANAVSLNDGRVALVYVDRTSAPLIKIRTSRDGGKSFDASTETIVHSPSLKNQTWNKSSMQDAWAEMGKFSLGLPAAAPLADGDVLVVYYAGTDSDHTDIRWARLRA